MRTFRFVDATVTLSAAALEHWMIGVVAALSYGPVACGDGSNSIENSPGFVRPACSPTGAHEWLRGMTLPAGTDYIELKEDNTPPWELGVACATAPDMMACMNAVGSAPVSGIPIGPCTPDVCPRAYLVETRGGDVIVASTLDQARQALLPIDGASRRTDGVPRAGRSVIRSAMCSYAIGTRSSPHEPCAANRSRGPMTIARTAWRAELPDVVVHTTEKTRNAHPSYAGAKSGDREAATRLACDLLSNTALGSIRRQLGGRRPLLVPVRAVEATGINLIPDAMSHEMALRMGLDVTLAIVQTNTVGHTRAGGFHRLAFQPTFDGKVEAGRDHLLVDDHVGLGSTLANLRGHIESHGGAVVLATTLSASRRSEVLALRPETLHSLSEKHGEVLDKYWRDHVGFGIDVLTEAEAGYLLRAPSVDAIRTGMAQARGG